MDHSVQIQLLNDLVKRDTIDLRNDLRIAHLLCIQRKKDILLINIGQCRKALKALQSFLF